MLRPVLVVYLWNGTYLTVERIEFGSYQPLIRMPALFDRLKIKENQNRRSRYELATKVIKR